jgi:serine/threonine-protein kinase RsbT
MRLAAYCMAVGCHPNKGGKGLAEEKNLIRETFSIAASDFAAAGDASGRIKQILKKLGISGDTLRRISVSSYEAEINLVIHTLGGVMVLEVSPDKISITSTDTGPGIKDVDLAMSKGYSTASESIRMMGFGAGMGLPNMKRCADGFHIESVYGEGTTIKMEFNL